jgi:mono/diheme cytochrome c family protein
MKTMKTKSLLLALFSAGLILTGCSKDDNEPATSKVTYNGSAKSVFVNNCAPCHVAGGGNPNKWDDYNTAKSKIDAILDRVNRDAAAAGFMPQGGAKLPATTIDILTQWKADGLLEN